MTTDDETPEYSTDQARRPRPVTEALRARVVELHGEGLGRNAIARHPDVGVSSATVTKIAREAGLSFDRSETELATRARLIDLADHRAVLARSFQLRAQELLEAMEGAVVIGNFGGRDNTWNETLLDEPTIEGKKALVTAAATAARAASELVRADLASTSTAEATGMVDALEKGLRGFADALAARGELPDPTETPDQR